MTRRVDPSLTKRALNALTRAADKAQASKEGLTEWEADFLNSVRERLNTYGSAFADPDKGQLSAPLSMRQGLKVTQIGKKGEEKKPKTSPKTASRGFSSGKKPLTQKPLARKTGLSRKGFAKKSPN